MNIVKKTKFRNRAAQEKLEKLENKIFLESQKEYIKNVAKYYNDPVRFSYEIIGNVHTDYQQNVMNLVADNKKVAWRSAHGLGKTFTASNILLWFLFTRFNSKIITTASNWRQVGLLWNEVGNKIRKMKLFEFGLSLKNIEVNLKEIRINSTWFAKGIASDEPETLEGEHAENILFIIDEAKLVNGKTFNSIKGALTSEGAKLLVISTPSENNSGYFFDIWAKNFDFVKVHTSAFDSPNVKQGKTIVPQLVTQQWIDECKEEWGEDSPTYVTKAKGDFPDVTEDTLIPYKLVDEAIKRGKEDPYILDNTDDIKELSCDVARFGSDMTVIMGRKGYKTAVLKTSSKKSTMETVGHIASLYEREKALCVKVDVIGVGGGVCDRLRELRGINVIDCDNAGKSHNNNFFNARAENYWELRRLFKEGLISIEDNKFLREELTSIKYKYHSSGKIMIESKEEIRKRLKRSPDFADALMYLFVKSRYGDSKMLKNIPKQAIKSNW